MIDPDVARRVITAQFPELDPIQIERLGEGCDSVAFDVNGTWVFRFPKRIDVEHQLDAEMKLLRWLTRRDVPVPIPSYSFAGRPTEAFPHRFGGYPKLCGAPANRAELSTRAIGSLAPSLGRFLSWLHAAPIDDALALGVADQRHIDALGEARHEAIEELPIVLRVLPDAPTANWRTYLEGARPHPRPSAFALVHNDLAAEHVLVDANLSGVTGVIDWSDAAVGDRATDLGGIFHWGGAALLDAVLAHYTGEIDDGLLSRARCLAAARGVLDVGFGLDRNDRSYIENGVRAIRWAVELE